MYEDEYILEERVDGLESLLGRFIVHTDTAITRLEREMRVFKNEMSVFKDEMKDFKDEMKDFKDEMKDFKDGTEDFKDEMRQDRRNMNKEWGKLANKMGTIVEDIVVPAIRPVIQKYFRQDVEYFSVNVRKKKKSLNLKGEFDVIAVTEDKVFLVETKRSPDEKYLSEFIEKIGQFRKLFPEYDDKPVIPLFASLRFDDELIRLSTSRNVYVLAYREWDYMDILNFSDVFQNTGSTD